MAHLSVREEKGRIDLAPAYQLCVARSFRYRKLGKATKITIAVAGVLILVLLKIWTPSEGASLKNMVIFYTVVAIAATVSLASAVSSVLEWDKLGAKYATAARALSRLQDRYTELDQQRPNRGNLALETWGKTNVYAIERLIEDPNIPDVDSAFVISNPPP